jgi:putative spermidine/putrescine transport system permease protein
MLLTLNRMGPGRYVLYAIGILTVVFLALPMIAIAALSFGSSQWMQFPPPSWTMRWYQQFLEDPRWLQAFLTSARIAVVVTALSVVLGLFASFALVRGRFRGRVTLSSLFISPMIVPVVITAVALYIVFLRIGLNGTFVGFVIGHLILALPFSVICITNSLRSFDESIEKAAIICGASPFTAIRRVTLPSIKGGLLAGAVFSFLISWDEVVMSIFLASPQLKTLPVMIWTSLHQDLSPVVAAVSTVLIAITLVVIVAMALLQKEHKQ